MYNMMSSFGALVYGIFSMYSQVQISTITKIICIYAHEIVPFDHEFHGISKFFGISKFSNRVPSSIIRWITQPINQII